MIADSSALAAFFLREPDFEQLAATFRAEPVHTLPLALKEVLNAAWKRVLSRKLGQREVAQLLQAVREAVTQGVLQLRDQADLFEAAFQIALEQRRSVYDALFLALAKRMGQRLLTLDQGQRKSAEALGIACVTFD